MKFVIQRVKQSNVKVSNNTVGEISKGLVVFVGISTEDTISTADYMVNKLLNLRIFEDINGKMNMSLLNINADILIVSQFTLYADCSSGNRPSFTKAAKPDYAENLYNYIVKKISENVSNVGCGIFGANMEVSLINDGPVTIILEK